MNISILIPSKERSIQLKENILKSKFPHIFKKVNYLILVDSNEEKQKYQKALSGLSNVEIFVKRSKFQSKRYAYLLDKSVADYYLIGSDDIYFENTDLNYKFDHKCNVLNCINEDKLIINHPIISEKVKKNLIYLLDKYNFNSLCIDTLISFNCNKNQRQSISLVANHLNFKKQITKSMYKTYLHDLIIFLIYALLNFLKFGDFKRNIIFIFFIIIDMLSAIKNYLLFSNKY